MGQNSKCDAGRRLKFRLASQFESMEGFHTLWPQERRADLCLESTSPSIRGLDRKRPASDCAELCQVWTTCQVVGQEPPRPLNTEHRHSLSTTRPAVATVPSWHAQHSAIADKGACHQHMTRWCHEAFWLCGATGSKR